MTLNWISIYNAAESFKAEIVKAVLLDHGINSVIVNKQDSSYHFGEVELHVHPDDVLLSKKIIKDNKL